jgi:hypothetical protein
VKTRIRRIGALESLVVREAARPLRKQMDDQSFSIGARSDCGHVEWLAMRGNACLLKCNR